MPAAKKNTKTFQPRADGLRKDFRVLGSPIEALQSDVNTRIIGAGAPGVPDQSTEEKIRSYFGAGAACDEPHMIAMHIVDGLDCGVEDLQSVAENRAFFEGPLTAASIASLFVPKLSMFNIGTAQGAVDQAQINVEADQLDCSVLITHVYFHLVPPKESMLVEGAAWGGTSVLTVSPQAVTPVVPDVWTVGTGGSTGGDATVNTGTLGLITGQTLTKAYLDVGGWAMDFYYNLVRAYEWLWKIGNNIILEVPLAKIATVVPSPQPSTSGRDRRPFAQYVADCNQYYRVNGTTALFLPRNATRDGSYAVTGGTPATQSLFSPYGYYEEDVTYGGPGVQSLGCNPDMYELPVAQLFPRSNKLGMNLALIDESAQSRAIRDASIDNAITGGAIPGIIYPDASITAASYVGSGTLPVFPELTSGSPNAQIALVCAYGTAVFKIGDFYLIAGLCGHRVSQTFYAKAIANLSTVCDAVSAATKGKRGLSCPAVQ
jgi:hypothetical protein